MLLNSHLWADTNVAFSPVHLSAEFETRCSSPLEAYCFKEVGSARGILQHVHYLSSICSFPHISSCDILGSFLLLEAHCEVPVIIYLTSVSCHQLKLTNLNPPKYCLTWRSVVLLNKEQYHQHHCPPFLNACMCRNLSGRIRITKAGCKSPLRYDVALWLAVCRLGELPRHLWS